MIRCSLDFQRNETRTSRIWSCLLLSSDMFKPMRVLTSQDVLCVFQFKASMSA
ncbi:Uncharacterized protein APZ42_005573 [Daphnia magna]|uniref:Uncharacterized protein n=1 Tax=Daphnia magna TaxID=35525 RepID=A0A164GDF0_9CRUS|nr:Uncharacterized protein APZ42_005573 [Daphnia magna]